jgi:FkbM family methyltransferase
LQQNIREFRNQRAFQYLLTDKDESTYDFHLSNNGGASSSIFDLGLHKELYPEVHFTETIRVASITLDAVVDKEKLGIKAYDILIMDTQGSELLVLKGACKTLRMIKWVLTECADFPAYEGCCQCDDISTYLNAAGFVEVKRALIVKREGVGTYFHILYRRQGMVQKLIQLFNGRRS